MAYYSCDNGIASFRTHHGRWENKLLYTVRKKWWKNIIISTKSYNIHTMYTLEMTFDFGGGVTQHNVRYGIQLLNTMTLCTRPYDGDRYTFSAHYIYIHVVRYFVRGDISIAGLVPIHYYMRSGTTSRITRLMNRAVWTSRTTWNCFFDNNMRTHTYSEIWLQQTFVLCYDMA